MVDLKEAATRKIGPLPAIAWGGIIGGGILAWRVLSGGGSSGGSGKVTSVGSDSGMDFAPEVGSGVSGTGADAVASGDLQNSITDLTNAITDLRDNGIPIATVPPPPNPLPTGGTFPGTIINTRPIPFPTVDNATNIRTPTVPVVHKTVAKISAPKPSALTVVPKTTHKVTATVTSIAKTATKKASLKRLRFTVTKKPKTITSQKVTRRPHVQQKIATAAVSKKLIPTTKHPTTTKVGSAKYVA